MYAITAPITSLLRALRILPVLITTPAQAWRRQLNARKVSVAQLERWFATSSTPDAVAAFAGALGSCKVELARLSDAFDGLVGHELMVNEKSCLDNLAKRCETLEAIVKREPGESVEDSPAGEMTVEEMTVVEVTEEVAVEASAAAEGDKAVV